MGSDEGRWILDRPGAASGIAARAGIGRHFFVLMAAVIAILVFAGFAPSFYLRGVFNPNRHLSMLLHLHGIALSAWIVLFLVQTILISKRSPTAHRRLGWGMAGLAVSIGVLMGAAIIEQMRRLPPEPPPPVALALGAFDILAFASLVSGGIWLRQRAGWHKRLMLSASLLLLGAAMVRIVVLLGADDLPKIMLTWPLLTDLLFVPCFIYDWYTLKKVHPAFLVGFGLIVMDQIAQPTVLAWPAWADLANTIQRWVT
jgi:hypothetical protein